MHRLALVSQDANEALLRGFDMKALLASARPVPHDQIATFDDLRDEVFREVLAPELLSGTPYVAWHAARWGVACSVRRAAAHHCSARPPLQLRVAAVATSHSQGVAGPLAHVLCTPTCSPPRSCGGTTVP